MGGFIAALRKYAKFSGRSRRREFWGFAVTFGFIHVLLSTLFVVGMQGSREGYVPPFAIVVGFVWLLAGLALYLPLLSVSWRRYQDIGWPGPLSLLGLPLPLLTLIVGAVPGNAGDNAYGPDPKAVV